MHSPNREIPQQFCVIRNDSIFLSALQMRSLVEIADTDGNYSELLNFTYRAQQQLDDLRHSHAFAESDPDPTGRIAFPRPKNKIVACIGRALFELHNQDDEQEQPG